MKRAIFLVLVLVLALAACSSDRGPSSADEVTTTTTSTSAADLDVSGLGPPATTAAPTTTVDVVTQDEYEADRRADEFREWNEDAIEDYRERQDELVERTEDAVDDYYSTTTRDCTYVAGGTVCSP